MTGDRSRAQDAVHQVFLKLLENGTQSQVVDFILADPELRRAVSD